MNKAFTLAEVLITLGIIGVVAAMTIPTLINNSQKQTYVTQLKKTYNQANEALAFMSMDMGCINDLKCTGLFDPAYSNNAKLGAALVKNFKVAKNCGTSINQGCFSTDTNYNYDGSSNSKYHYDAWGGYSFITADGMSIVISGYDNDCGHSWSSGATGNMSQTCGVMFIDVNGPTKGPNNYGRDTFQFFMTNGKGALLYPRGGKDDAYGLWWKNAFGNPQYCYIGNLMGEFCAGRVMEEGWQMNY